ncbi:MAG: hypothetical protein JXA96_01945 [Sedimentisphaerales bacterium]|nr:hypothetical protein [Sedimentisphaerales bacterium]
MKRLIYVMCVAGMLVTIAMPNYAIAKPEEKVSICHVNSANDVLPTWWGVLVFGKEIEVAESAVEAHLAQGDSLFYLYLPEGLRDFYEDFYGIKLPNADSFFFVPWWWIYYGGGVQ